MNPTNPAPRKSSYVRTNDGAICVFANNRALPPVGREHPNYQAVIAALRDDNVEKLIELTNIPKAVTNFAKGKVEVKDGIVYYNSQPLHNGLTDRILQLMNEQFPFEPMLRFLENIMQNMSYQTRQELYDFLAHHHLPITDDGCFLAYKHVRDNFFDIYSGKFDNSIGKVVEVDRGSVDDDRSKGCSEGLHVGAIEYVKTYSGAGCEAGGRYIICKVNPKDVVSVPTDCNCTKLRTCRYEVMGLYEGDLQGPLYTSTAVRAEPSSYPSRGGWGDDDDEDEDYDDDQNDFEDDDDDEEEVFDDDDNEDEDDLPPQNDLPTQPTSDPTTGFSAPPQS